MNNAITTIQELGIRKDAAMANQDKLNEYFDLALKGKINITRDSITSLLEQFDFSEEEQREAAKILMFPEDALYIYDSKINNADVQGKSISEVISEAKDAIIEDEKQEEINNLEEPVIEETKDIEPKENDIDFKLEEKTKPVEEDAIFNPFVIEDIPVNENVEIKEDNIFNSNESLEDYLTSLGFNYLEFSSQDLDELKDNFDKETMKKNVELIKDKNIDLDIFTDHVSLLYDKELTEKIQILLNIGKEPIDIYLNPSILVKYSTERLNNAIALLTSNGMDPKNVPLMAY